jgi:glycosyltransferase involved in cell wall biosynthesis
MTFATSLDYRGDPRYVAMAQPMLPSSRQPTAIQEIRMFADVLRLARRSKVLLVRSSWGRTNPDMLATAVIGLWPQHLRPNVVVSGCMWEPKSGPRGLLQRLVVTLADRAVTRYAVQSSEELTVFAENWGVCADKLRLCLYFYTFTEKDLLAAEAATEQRELPPAYIFAGGNSHRDYEPLLEAARRLPAHQFMLATNRLVGQTLPDNVWAAPVSHHEFVRLMQMATAVVVPLKAGMRRAVGQQTYLNAMWLGKPTIVSPALGVRDHIRHSVDAWLADGTAEGYVTAINWLFDPLNETAVDQMCAEAAYTVRNRFRFEDHVTSLLAIVTEVIHTG